MKVRLIILSILFGLISNSAESQILKKLKKKVEETTEKVLLKKTEEQTEKTVESAFDTVLNPNSGNTSKDQNKSGKSSNDAKLINTEAKRAFYTSDVIVRTSDNEGKGSEYYFDSDEIAARGEAPNAEKSIFIDSEGFQYGYNKGEGRWEKTGIMRTDGMSFMMPAMSMGILKLPVEPTMDAAEKLKQQGLNMNTFQIVEWAFIYKPEHFRNGQYEETTAPCPGGGSCPKFIYTDPENKGSWVVFDSQGRLSEIYAKVDNQQAKGEGSYKFFYEPVSVSIPNAVEVKMPFQDLFLSGMDTDPGGNNSTEVNKSGNNTPSTSTSGNVTQNSMSSTAGKGGLNEGDLPATYEFDWQYHLKMDMPNQKNDPLDLVMLLKENTNYQGIKMKIQGTGEATMVFDLKMNALVMFMQSGDGKFFQIHSMDNTKNIDDIPEMQIRNLPDKTVIGFKSKGVEIENDDYIAQVYHTTEAPIKTSGLFNFSEPMDKKIPNIDTALIKRFSDGLVTEMHYTDKKDSKNKVSLTAQSLNQVKTSIKTGNYQNLSFMGQLKPKN
ncbi:hypothetical protein ML462_08105 [Gramella lutea]|uniref:DUF4412 domain-containing protein n=1 Tax=Christiangramia lutea TaxID=1607951 RepID=A0A9X2AB68_9FLAO|nr:hypothetical protein [Christiangramia lutea]MCH4823137.1 hypothetical protein [Christiangramia lutea]